MDNIILDDINFKLLDKCDMIVPTFLYHDLFFNDKHISINDMFCYTRKYNVFKEYCNIFSNLIEIYKNIKNLMNNFNSKGGIKKKYSFNETILDFYLIQMCKFNIKEIDLLIGLNRKDHILLFPKLEIQIDDFKKIYI